ncbi:hypothetical protein AVEN_86498-1 [Araneus ventricosus]|uniref:Fibronectin type-III domain-containing protein n=1 Tax=Araneus ventricosus TaxID=182803 RepID=A0A4Y2JPV5_ARAVE|nr:hypothetical protein AVEN_86498-1 [Araneus ventricosus]
MLHGVTRNVTWSILLKILTFDLHHSNFSVCRLPPRNLTLAALRGYCIYLKWDPPKNAYEVPFDMYFIETQNTEENQWKMYFHASNRLTAVKLCGLDDGDHKFRIRTWSKNKCGYSDPSNEISLDNELKKGIDVEDYGKPWEEEQTKEKKNPGKVDFLRIIFKYRDCVYLKWKPPGSPAVVNGYVIESRKKGQRFEELVNMSFPIVHVKLCGMGVSKMEFRVRPYNEHGSGPPSKPAQQMRNNERPMFNEAEFKFYDLRSEEEITGKQRKKKGKKPNKFFEEAFKKVKDRGKYPHTKTTKPYRKQKWEDYSYYDSDNYEVISADSGFIIQISEHAGKGRPSPLVPSCPLTSSFHLLLNKLSRIKIAKLISFHTDNEDLIKQQPDATSLSDSDPDFSPSPDLRLMEPDPLEPQCQGP